MFRTLKLMIRTLQSWWSADQIRVSPFAGRLFTLQPGMQIQLCDRLFLVRQRHWDEASRRMTYELQSDNGPASLTAALGQQPEAGWLQVDGQKVDVFSDDITLLPPHNLLAPPT